MNHAGLPLVFDVAATLIEIQMNDIQKSFDGDLSADKIEQELDMELAQALGEGSIEDMMEQSSNTASAPPSQSDPSDDNTPPAP